MAALKQELFWRVVNELREHKLVDWLAIDLPFLEKASIVGSLILLPVGQ